MRAIVLPPAHGKSYIVGKGENPLLREADQVYPYRHDDDLVAKRLTAKLTGDWRPYDAAWAVKLKERCNPADIIMVPHAQIAKYMDIEIIAVCVLTVKQWEKNLFLRDKTPKDYLTIYADASKAATHLFVNNKSLYEAVLEMSWK